MALKLVRQVSALCFALGPFVVGVSANCYTSGVLWEEDRDNAAYHAERACRGYDGQQGVFQGVFQPNERRHVCVELSGTIYADFVVQNLNLNQAFDIADDDCVQRLHNEIYGCDFGGITVNADWRFMYVLCLRAPSCRVDSLRYVLILMFYSADPNNGFCS